VDIIRISDKWREAYPGAAAGFLALSQVHNIAVPQKLKLEKEELQNSLRRQFAAGERAALKELPVFQSYAAYYSRFKKTYPVFLQLESVVIKGREIPNVTALVTAMFMAELKNGLLTAGHDMHPLNPPINLEVAEGRETYVILNGEEKELKAKDMMMRDEKGIISSIVYGPDKRTAIGLSTQSALFAVYAPPGITPEAVERHLDDIARFVLLAAPQAKIDLKEVYSA
jgi:DNA/RNA-binding domain of Phe-tRNA-synthetase-like protein